MSAPNPLVARIADGLQDAYAHAFRMRSDAEDAARIALAACRAAEMLGTIRLLTSAKDEKEQHGNTPHYEALKAEGWKSARALLAELDGLP